MTSQNPRFKRFRILSVTVLFGLTLSLLLVIAFSSTRSRETLNAALHAIEREQQIRNLVLLIRQHTIAAETAERGFLITGEEQYLEPYERALSHRSTRMASLEEFAKGIPEIEDRLPDLKSLIQARDGELEAAIALRRENNIDETVEAVRDGMRRNLSEQIREVLHRMEETMDAKLKTAETEYRHQIDRMAFIMSLAAYLSLALGLLGLVLLIRHLRDQIRTVRLERDKEEAVRLAQEKSRFLASMNHEIRTPLNAILGFCELLENEVPSDRGRRYLATIRTSGHVLADLINDILDLSKIESGMLDLSPGPVNVPEFAKGLQVLFEEQARAAGLRYEFAVDEECPDVLVFDPIRVRQILVNFLGNALKFTSHGSIRGFIWAREFQGGKCDVVFSVQDTGRGIAPEKMELIFQPFRQAEVSDETLGGTGLGLSICHELAVLMGGEIEVTSEVGEGTEFLLVLKQVDIVKISGAPRDEAPVKADFDDLPPSRILVVDDNSFNIELISEFFEGSHHRLDFSGNGLEALDMMRRDNPDIVLMDIRMPVMGGDEAYLLMRRDERLASIPVIAMTASALSGQQRLRELFDGYLRKPFTRAEVFQVMKTALSRRGSLMKERERERRSRGAPVVPDGSSAGAPASSPPLHDDGRTGGLIEELTTLGEERWGLLMRAMLLSDVASVADELSEIAKRYDEPDLSAYAHDLRKAVEQIDQPRIEDLLKRFNELIEKLS